MDSDEHGYNLRPRPSTSSADLSINMQGQPYQPDGWGPRPMIMPPVMMPDFYHVPPYGPPGLQPPPEFIPYRPPPPPTQFTYNSSPLRDQFYYVVDKVHSLFPELPPGAPELLVRRMIGPNPAQRIKNNPECGITKVYQHTAMVADWLPLKCVNAYKWFMKQFYSNKTPSYPSVEDGVAIILPAMNQRDVGFILREMSKVKLGQSSSSDVAVSTGGSTDTDSIPGGLIFLDDFSHVDKDQPPPDASCVATPTVLQDFLSSPAAKRLVLKGIKESLNVTTKLLSSSLAISEGLQVVEGSTLGLNGLKLSSDIEFGTHRALPLDVQQLEATVSGLHTGHASLLDILQLSETPTNNSNKEYSALHFQQLVFTNTSTPPSAMHQHSNPHGEVYWILGAVATPQLPHTYTVYDKARLFWAHDSTTRSAVYLQPGQTHRLTVAFSCADGPARAEERGILQQMLVFIIAVPKGTAAYSQLKNTPEIATVEVGEYVVFTVARRVTACVVPAKNADLVEACLDVEAKPYISRALKDLLDSEARVVFESCKDAEAGLLQPPLVSALPHQKNPIAQRHYDEYKKYNDLLLLEAASMQQDIKRYDLFFSRLKLAVFKADGARYRLFTIHDDNNTPQSETTYLYRGPDVLALQREGICKTVSPAIWVLGHLEVAGLLEGRPGLVIGDTVSLRLADQPDVQLDATIASIEGNKVFLLMPKMFFSAPLVAWIQHHNSGTTTSARPGLGGLVHVRFTYDTRPLAHMKSALHTAASMNINKPMDQQCCLYPGAYHQNNAPAVIEVMQPTIDTVGQFASTFIEKGKQKLNAEQRHAVAAVVCGAGRACPYTLNGPPGTGKTVTLVEMVLQILDTYKDDACLRILLCAPQNYSADLLCSALAAAGITTNDMVRVNDPRRPPFTVKDDVLDFSLYNKQTRMFDTPSHHELKNKKVVVCTCSAASMLVGSSSSYGGYSHVLIDEAGQALLPEALIPLTLLQPPLYKINNGCWGAVLCGDPAQLGPSIRNPEAAAAGLATSLLEAFITQHTSTAVEVLNMKRVPCSSMLVRNYRSSKQLLDLPSRMFYESRLLAAADPSTVQPPSWTEMQHNTEDDDSNNNQQGGASLMFYGVNGQQLREGDVPSYFNVIEASTVVELIQGLLDSPGSGVVPDDIGVMATYRKQVQKIRLMLRKCNLGSIRVGTLDDYQGQEERIIFISTVLSKPQSLPTMSASNNGPTTTTTDANTTSVAQHMAIWRNPKRFNVAITRAKALMVVVGHPAVLLEDASWRQLLQYCVGRGVYRGAGVSTMKQRFRFDPGSQALSLPSVKPSGVVDVEENDEFGMTAWTYSNGNDHQDDDHGDEYEDDEEIQKAIDKIAALAVLGAGDASSMFPSMDEMEDAYADEVKWRVML